MGVKRMIEHGSPNGAAAAKKVAAVAGVSNPLATSAAAVPIHATTDTGRTFSGAAAAAPSLDSVPSSAPPLRGDGANDWMNDSRISSLLRTASSLNDYAVGLHNQEGSDPSAAMRLFRQARETFVKSIKELDRRDEEHEDENRNDDGRRSSSEPPPAARALATEGAANGGSSSNKRARSATTTDNERLTSEKKEETKKKRRVRWQQQQAQGQEQEQGSSEQLPQDEEEESSNDGAERRRQKPEEEARPTAAASAGSAEEEEDNEDEDDANEDMFLGDEEPPPYCPMDDYDDEQYGLGLYREETDDAHGGTVRFRRPIKMSAYYPPCPPHDESAGGDMAARAASRRGAAVASFNLALARDRLFASPKSAMTAVETLASSPSVPRLLDSAASHLQAIPVPCRSDRDRSLEVMVHNNAAGAHIQAGGNTTLALRSLLRALRVEAPEKYQLKLPTATSEDSRTKAQQEEQDARDREAREKEEEKDEGSIVSALAYKLTALHAIGLVRQNEATNKNNQAFLLGLTTNNTNAAAIAAATAAAMTEQDREADDYLLRQSITSSNVGQIYFRSLRFSESAAACLISDTLRSAVLPGGPNHVLAAACKYNLGLILHRLGDVASAGRCYATFLTIAESWTADKEEDEDTDAPNAYPVIDRALRSSIASARHQWGLVLSALGDKHNAITSLLRVLSERRSLHGNSDCHPDIAKTLFSLGQVLFESGRMAESSLYFEEALRVSRSLRLDPSHMIFVFTLSYLAQIRQRLGDGRAAISLYDEALVLAQRAFGDTHYVVINLLNVIGNLRVSRGEMNAARRCFTRASGIYVLSIMRGCKQALETVRRQQQAQQQQQAEQTQAQQQAQSQGGQRGAAAAGASTPRENGNGAGAGSSSAMTSARAIGGTGDADGGGAFVVVTTCKKIVAKAA